MRIVIVGASSGIGREVAQEFIRRGYRVGVAARRLDALEGLVRLAPERVVARTIDVRAESAPEDLSGLIEALGGMDIYLNVAGIGKQNPELQADIELDTVRTNALGFTRMVTAAFDWMGRHGGGQIAVVSSIAGTKGLGSAPSYSATKRFQNTYIEALAQLSRMRGLKIRFTDIRPGFVDTDLLNDGKKYPMLMRADKVSKRIVRAIESGERVCTIDFRYRVMVFFWRLIPLWLWERLAVRN